MYTNLIALPRNFMSVVDPLYYIPKEIQEGFDSDNTEVLSNGDVDPVAMLFSNENLPSYPPTIQNVNQGNPYNITYRGQWNDYDISGGYWTQSVGLDAAALPILLPSVLGNMLAVEAGDEMKVQIADEND